MTLVLPMLGANLAPEATAIAEFYLFDTGGNFTSMVKTALGVDIDGMLASFNATRDSEIAVRGCLQHCLHAHARGLLTPTHAAGNVQVWQGHFLDISGLTERAEFMPVAVAAN